MLCGGEEAVDDGGGEDEAHGGGVVRVLGRSGRRRGRYPAALGG